MKFSVVKITFYDGADFFWATVSIKEEEKDELGTYKSCEVQVSFKKQDLKMSEIEQLAIEKAKSFIASALNSCSK
ncbi:hypothetical protein [Shewanella algae]|uniref:hypothetical protein n=1 Tax=Shewanella algae TaxID=38313 RepID=UPI001C56CA15|nr:hypothetical protein [Shewanella algae]